MYSGRNLLRSIWLIVVIRLVLREALDVEIPNPPIRRVRDKSVKAFPVDLETSFVEFGVNHNFAFSQMNDRLKIVRHFVLSNKHSGVRRTLRILLRILCFSSRVSDAKAFMGFFRFFAQQRIEYSITY